MPNVRQIAFVALGAGVALALSQPRKRRSSDAPGARPGASPVYPPPHELGPGESFELLDFPGLASTSPQFRETLAASALRAGLNPNYISAVMSLESGYDPNVQNFQGAPALGLIQFWRDYFPAVARRAGQPEVTWEDLRSMTASDQVPFVIAFFRASKLPGLGSRATPTDYYMTAFLPAFVGRDPSFVLGREGSQETLAPGLSLGAVYAQNKGLDVNGDGLITVGDVGAKIERRVEAAREKPRVVVRGTHTGPQPVA